MMNGKIYILVVFISKHRTYIENEQTNICAYISNVEQLFDYYV